MTSPAPRAERLTMFNSSRNRLMNASWLYPFKGIYYFATHRFLWPLLRARLLPALLLSTFVLVTLFIWTYLPQVAFLALFQGKTAWFNGAILVLEEAAVVTALLFEAFLVDETQVDVFDAILYNEGYRDLVSSARDIRTDAPEDDPVQVLGKPTKSAQYAPFSLRLILEGVLFLPLNFIPVAGPVVYIIAVGRRAGPFHHWRYFKLLDLSKKEMKQLVEKRKLKYTWFGAVALTLQLVPPISMLFLLTTAAGAALWAVRLEEERAAFEPAQIQPGEYQDDPV